MRKIFFLFIAMLLLAGCSPKLVCESPSNVIDGRCCLDADDNMVCDSDEEPVEPVEVVQAEPVEPVEVPKQVAPVTAQVVKEIVPTPGRFKILNGEPKQYVTIDKLEMHRYSTDKITLDYLWYTVRNIGGVTLNPEVRIRADGIRRANQEGDGTSSQEFTYNLDSIKPGEKLVIRLPIELRFGQINKTRDLTIEVYERFVAPKEVKGEAVKSFVPFDELEDTEIWWVDRED